MKIEGKLEEVDISDNTIIDYKTNCLARCWKRLCINPFASPVEVINEDSVGDVEMDGHNIIEYKSQTSECWGHTWKFLNRNRIVAYVVTGLSVLCGLTVLVTSVLYGASMGTGIGLSELAYSKTYFGETDVASSPIGQYLLTPLIGLATLCASILVCGSLCIIGAGASTHER